MSLNDIGRCENCGCNLPEQKPSEEILSVEEIFDILRLNLQFGIEAQAKFIHKAMRKKREDTK